MKKIIFNKIEEKFDLKNIITVFTILILSLILTFMIEVTHRINISAIELLPTIIQTIEWSLTNTTHFLFNYFIVLSVLSAISSLIGCIYVGFSISSILLIFLTLVNSYKLTFRGDPLFPWDLLLSNESTNMLQYITDKSDIIKLIIIFVSLLSIGFLRLVLPKFSFKIKYRIPVFIIAIFLAHSFVFTHSLLGTELYERNNITNIKWAQEQSYLDNGFILAFSINVKNAIVSPPKDYTSENVQKVVENAIIDYNNEFAHQNDVQPNVIIVMNEAFWDPTLLENVTFSNDPIPFFRKLHNEYTSGWLKSPEFGGGTSNIEFEVMTGNSMKYLPPGTMAFQQYLGQPVMSLASILKNQGYESIGIHSYHGWFWNRIEAYKNLGFDQFISMEYFTDLRYQGWHISDEVVTDMIIDKVEKNENPVFIYSVTMQNHGPYNTERYTENTIKVEGDLSSESKVILETYMQGLVDADKSLEKLIRYLEGSDEPTVVVFFGDHLPMLGQKYSVYTEAGYIQSSDASLWNYAESLNMKQVPVIIWSNYHKEREDIGVMNTSFLGPYLLNYINNDMPEYFKFLLSLSKTTPVIDNEFAITSDNEFIDFNHDIYKKITNSYELIQYDQFFGRNYLDYASEDKWFVKNNPYYNTQINDITISNVRINGDKVIVEGDKFVPNVLLNINGRNNSPTYINQNLLEINVADINLSTNSPNKIQAKLTNSKGVLLTESNEYIIE